MIIYTYYRITRFFSFFSYPSPRLYFYCRRYCARAGRDWLTTEKSKKKIRIYKPNFVCRATHLRRRRHRFGNRPTGLLYNNTYGAREAAAITPNFSNIFLARQNVRFRSYYRASGRVVVSATSTTNNKHRHHGTRRGGENYTRTYYPSSIIVYIKRSNNVRMSFVLETAGPTC